MAKTTGAVWAIDIGNNSLKALQMSLAGDTVEVIGFDNIQHGKILSGGGVDETERAELIAMSLRQFVQNNDLGKDEVAVSVPSQNSFARFVKLPPVEKKRIPEIVKFEAAQQIPFDISEVQWDWQMMSEPGSSEVRVGIFAIKSEVVSSELDHFSGENVRVSCVQMAPMALYNYILHDRPELFASDDQATVILNIGAENTDLVVCTKSSVWQRCVPMGGNSFTKAVAETFKLNFEKAEKLKRTAPMSKYARQILQAMKPVFADMGSEIQRSLGFYSNSNPNTKVSRIVAFGGGTKMRGLLKYLQQTLQLPIERPDSFKRLGLSSNVSAAKFHDSVSDFGIVYGLGLQALGQARIESNLLPRRIARSMAWVSKARFFNIAAGMLLGVSVLSLGRTLFDKANYENKQAIRQKIDRVISSAQEAENRVENERSKSADYEAIIEREFKSFEYRDTLPLLHNTILSVLPNGKNTSDHAELFKAFNAGDVKSILNIPRKARKQIFVTSMSVCYVDNIEQSQLGSSGSAAMRGGAVQSKSGGRPSERRGSGRSRGSSGMTAVMERMYGSGRGSASGPTELAAGFVVSISGYTPYEAIGELMDPVGVGDDRTKWGVVTRLMHLDDFVDGNSPFKLYKKTEVEHFRLQTGEVSLDEGIPEGIGIAEIKKIGPGGIVDRSILVDPLTKETISKVPEIDEDGRERVDRSGNVIYQVNDHWFMLNMKFIWKRGPEET